MSIRVAIIGLGVVGKKRKFFIEKNKNYKLVAASDIRFKKDFSRNGVKYFKNYQDILKLKYIDAIFVTLPNYLSAKVTKEALRKKFMFFVKNLQQKIITNFQKCKSI